MFIPMRAIKPRNVPRIKHGRVSAAYPVLVCGNANAAKRSNFTKHWHAFRYLGSVENQGLVFWFSTPIVDDHIALGRRTPLDCGWEHSICHVLYHFPATRSKSEPNALGWRRGS